MVLLYSYIYKKQERNELNTHRLRPQKRYGPNNSSEITRFESFPKTLIRTKHEAPLLISLPKY